MLDALAQFTSDCALFLDNAIASKVFAERAR
jgi:hypothetical protein